MTDTGRFARDMNSLSELTTFGGPAIPPEEKAQVLVKLHNHSLGVVKSFDLSFPSFEYQEEDIRERGRGPIPEVDGSLQV